MLVADPVQKEETVPEDPQVSKAFQMIDKNGDGVLSRSEVIKACRKEDAVRELLGLPRNLKDDDRDKFEGIFQGMDEDHDKCIDRKEFQRWFAMVKAGEGPRFQPSAKAVGEDGKQLALPAASEFTEPYGRLTVVFVQFVAYFIVIDHISGISSAFICPVK